MTASRPIITVVIPVYNAGKYLTRCLDSLLSQSFQDFEVRCVDDASTDDSYEILMGYVAKDPRIKVTRLPENQGVGHARNVGMDLSEGEFIYFLDSDDWLDFDYLESMYRHALSSGLDIVINHNWVFEGKSRSKSRRGGEYGFIRDEAGYYTLAQVQSVFLHVLWCRLFRLKFLRDNNIRFTLTRGAEDLFFVYLSEAIQGKCYIFSGPFYHYYQRDDSLNKRKDVLWHHFLNYAELSKELQARQIPPSGSKRFYLWDTPLRIDSEHKFDFVKSFFSSVETDVRSSPDLYSVFECYVMVAVLSCRDYISFRIRYFLDFPIRYRLMVLLNRRWPSVTTILDGSWKVK